MPDVSGNAFTITVPPQRGPLPFRGEVLGAMTDVLLDAAEALHGRAGTAWMAERLSEHERDMTLLACRYVMQMMIALHLQDEGEGA